MAVDALRAKLFGTTGQGPRDGVQVVDEVWKVFLNNNSKRLKNEVACIIKVTFSLNVT